MMQAPGITITKPPGAVTAVTPPGGRWHWLAMKRGDVADALEKVNTSLRVQRQQSSGDGVESAGIGQQWAEESSARVYFRLS